MIGAALLFATTTLAEPPKRAFELSSLLGVSFVTGAPLANAFSDRRAGLAGSLSLRYRNPYFLAPLVNVGYALLSSGAARIPRGEPGGGQVIEDHLGAWHVALGVSADVLRLRLGLAAAGYVFGLRSSVGGDTSRTDALVFGPMAFASLTAVRAPRFHLGVDLAAHIAPAAGVNYITLGLSLHGDIAKF